MKKLSLIMLISSLLTLLGACIGWGFYDEIMQSGFNPIALLLICTIFPILGLIVGFVLFLWQRLIDEAEKWITGD